MLVIVDGMSVTCSVEEFLELRTKLKGTVALGCTGTEPVSPKTTVYVGDLPGSVGTDSVTSSSTKDSDVVTKCPYGKMSDSCERCRAGDHACKMAVLACIPPKYNVCPCFGSGYVNA